MNPLQFVTLLYRFFCLFVCVWACAWKFMWYGCVWLCTVVCVCAFVPTHFSGSLSHQSTLSQHTVQCRTPSMLSLDCEESAQKKWIEKNLSLDLTYTCNTQCLCGCLLYIWLYASWMCMTYRWQICTNIFIYLFDFWSAKFCFVFFSVFQYHVDGVDVFRHAACCHLLL